MVFGKHGFGNFIFGSDSSIGEIPPSEEVVRLENYGFEVVFRNRQNEEIARFSSQLNPLLYCELKYERHSGVKTGKVRMIADDVPYYNDMIVEIRFGSDLLATTFVTAREVDLNVLTLSLEGAFSRFGDRLYTSYISNVTMKGAVLYFIQLIKGELGIEGGFFYVNDDKIILDDEIILSSVDFVDKSAIDILNGFTKIFGKCAYGIDADDDFYFINQDLVEAERFFADINVFDLDTKVKDGSVVNRVRLFGLSQTGDSLGLITVYDDEDSQAIYGVRQEDVEMPFHLGSGDPAPFAVQAVQAEPVLSGKFTKYQPDNVISTGRYYLSEFIRYKKRKVFNMVKSDSDYLPFDEFPKTLTNFITGKHGRLFSTGQSATIPQQGGVDVSFFKDIVVFCSKIGSTNPDDQLKITLLGDEAIGEIVVELALAYDEFNVVAIDDDNALAVENHYPIGEGPFEAIIYPSNVPTQINIPRATFNNVDGLLTIRYIMVEWLGEGNLVLDSIHYTSDGVETSTGYYGGHELIMDGQQITATIELAPDENDFVDMVSATQKNAKLGNEMAKLRSV